MTDDLTYRSEPDPAFADHLEHLLVQLLDVPTVVPTPDWPRLAGEQAEVEIDGAEQRQRRLRRRRELVALVAAAALVVGVVAALQLRGDRADDRPIDEPPSAGLIALVGDYRRVDGSGFYDFVSDIYVIESDGTGLRALTATRDQNETSPAWSPDGSRLAFLRDVHRGSAQLVVMDPYTGAEQLHADVPMHMNTDPAVPVWAPDGRSIVVRIGNDYNKLIDLSTGEWTVYPQGISFSPDGKWVLVPTAGLSFTLIPAEQLTTARCHGDPECGTSPMPGGRVVLTTRDFNTIVGWTPDSSALTLNTLTGNRSIELISIADGRRRTLLEDASNYSWSHTGDQIAFLRNFQPVNGAGAEVWVASADGSDAHQVATSSIWPTWSPDGTSLILEGVDGLFTVRPDGTNMQPLNRSLRFHSGDFHQFDDFDPTGPHEWPPDMFGPAWQSMPGSRGKG